MLRLRRQRKNVGSGSATVPRNTADAALLTAGRYVRLTLDGSVRQVFRIVGRSQNTVDSGEHAGQLRTVSGAGLPALLGDARIAAPVNVYGWRADTRYWNFASPDYPHESSPLWGSSVVLFDYGDPAGYGAGVPRDWPDPTAKWMWSRAAAFADPPMPVGDTYYRGQFTLAADTDVTFYITADDGFELWVDGELLADATQAFAWRDTHKEKRFLFSGTHHVAIKGTNIDRPISVTNFAGILFACFTTTAGGADDTLLIHSDDTWLAADYPATPPGWTVGAIFDVLLSEAQLRGSLAPWSWTFTALLDSLGGSWHTTISPASKIGTRYDDFLIQLGAWACDWNVDYDTIELLLMPFATTPSASGVTLVEGVNLQSLSHEEQNTSGTELYGRLSDGTYFWDTNGGSPQIEIYAELGSASTVEDGSVQADALFAELGASTTATAVIAPVAGVIPWVDYEVGDSLTADDMDGTSMPNSIDAVTAGWRPPSDDGRVGGSVEYALELVAPVTTPAAAHDDWADALLIAGASGLVVGDNTYATTEPSEPIPVNGPGDGPWRSVWFRWVAPSSGDFAFSTQGSRWGNGNGLDTVLGIYTGASLAALVEVSSNDDNTPFVGLDNFNSLVTFTAVMGTTYYVQLSGYSADEFGIYRLGWETA